MNSDKRQKFKVLFEYAFKDGLVKIVSNKNKIIDLENYAKEFKIKNITPQYENLINDFIHNEKNKIDSWEELLKFMEMNDSYKTFFEIEDNKFMYSKVIEFYPAYNWKKMLLFRDLYNFIDFYLHDYSDEFNQLFFDMLYEKWENISLPQN